MCVNVYPQLTQITIIDHYHVQHSADYTPIWHPPLTHAKAATPCGMLLLLNAKNVNKHVFWLSQKLSNNSTLQPQFPFLTNSTEKGQVGQKQFVY